MPESKHRTIGFLSSNRPSPADLHQGGSAEEKEILLPLDNGSCISFPQGIRNIIVLGQTGSGKSTSVVTSAVDDDAIPLDFGDLVYRQNKIVFVQFAVNSGLAGEMLCKTIKEQYYKAIMGNR